MKITQIHIWHVSLKSHISYDMADGKRADTVTSVVCRIDTDTQHAGWGEVCPIPHYLDAYATGVVPAVAEMAPVLIGADPVGPDALMARLDAHLIGHPYAKSMIDTALWDLTGKAAGLPCYRLLGGRLNETLPLYHSITCIAPDAMAQIARETYDAGVRQFQAKLGADNDWRNDLERLRAVRQAVGDAPLVYGDWNCGASMLQAIRTARAAADLDIMIEQPCATLEDCAAVKQATGLPMKIDENARDTASLLAARRLNALDAVAIKLSKFGGLSAARRARDLCYHLGAVMCIEDTWGSDITTAAALHLAASTRPRYLMNVADLSGYVSPRLDERAPTRADGAIAPPDGIGLGINPDSGVLGDPVADF